MTETRRSPANANPDPADDHTHPIIPDLTRVPVPKAEPPPHPGRQTAELPSPTQIAAAISRDVMAT